MSFHEVPKYLETLHDLEGRCEGVVVAVVGGAVDHLLAAPAAAPAETRPPLRGGSKWLNTEFLGVPTLGSIISNISSTIL